MPDLTFFDSRENAKLLVELIDQLQAGKLAPSVDRIVLVGFSAGGLATLLAAASPSVVGYVGLDSFDRPDPATTDPRRSAQRCQPLPSAQGASSITASAGRPGSQAVTG